MLEFASNPKKLTELDTEAQSVQKQIDALLAEWANFH